MNKDSILREKEFYKQIIKLIFPYKKRFVTLFIVTIIQSIVMVMLSVLFGGIINEMVYHQELRTFYWIVFLVLFLVMTYVFFEFVNTAAFWNTQLRFVLDLRVLIMKKVFYAKADYLAKIKSGDVVYSVNLDTPEFMNVITDNVFETFCTMISCLAVILVLLLMNPVVVVFLVIAIPVMLLLTTRLSVITRKFAVKLRENKGTFNAWLYEIIKGLDDIRINGGKEGVQKYFQEKKGLLMEQELAIKMNQLGIQQLNGAISLISKIGLFLLFAFAAFVSSATVGLFSTTLTLMTFIMDKLIQLNDFFVLLQTRKVSLERVYNYILMESEKEEKRTEEIHVQKGSIKFENVSFGYDEKKVVHDINFEIMPGEKIGIWGENGTGKSTLFQLLLGFYNPSEGKILIDDQDITLCKKNSLRKQISIVQQEVIVFNDTIWNNITLGKKYEVKDVEKACRIAHIHEFIASLPEKYDTKLGYGGINLSGGQKQRISIARMLLKDVRIMLLDEASSSLDGNVEAMIEDELFSQNKDKTMLVISHKLSTLEKMDRLMILKDGNILMFDTPQKVKTGCAEFADVFLRE